MMMTRHRLLPMLLVVLLAGCAARTPALSPTQTERWQQAQEFLAAISKAYGLSGVTLQVSEGHTGGEIATVKGQAIVIEKALLDYKPWVVDKVIAHEAAHVIHGDFHRMRTGWTSRSEAVLALRGFEVEADVKVIEILQRVRGYTECKALLHVLFYKTSQVKALAAGTIKAWPEGHWPPHEEHEMILARFPTHHPWTGKCPT